MSSIALGFLLRAILFVAPLRLYLVNFCVSRETPMLMLHHRETVCCLPSYPTRKASGIGHLLVCLLHFGLRPVQQDRLRICPLQCRQRQQNISLVCVHKAGLSFAKIPNWDGLSRQMSEPKWTKSKLRQTFQRLSSATEESAKCRPTAHLLEQEIGSRPHTPWTGDSPR